VTLADVADAADVAAVAGLMATGRSLAVVAAAVARAVARAVAAALLPRPVPPPPLVAVVVAVALPFLSTTLPPSHRWARHVMLIADLRTSVGAARRCRQPAAGLLLCGHFAQHGCVGVRRPHAASAPHVHRRACVSLARHFWEACDCTVRAG